MVNESSATLLTTSLTGTYIVGPSGAGQFSISYITPPTNNPELADRAGTTQCICVWAVTSVSAIYTSAPLSDYTRMITTPASTGSVTIPNFTRKPSTIYVVAYCYGEPDYTKKINPIGAALVFASGENTGVPTTPTLTTPTIMGSSSVYSSFATPTGNNPFNNHNWYGIAEGSTITNDGQQQWLKTSMCDASMKNNKATAYFDDVDLSVGCTYSFAFGYYTPNNYVKTPSVGMYYVFTADSAE